MNFNKLYKTMQVIPQEKFDLCISDTQSKIDALKAKIDDKRREDAAEIAEINKRIEALDLEQKIIRQNEQFNETITAKKIQEVNANIENTERVYAIQNENELKLTGKPLDRTVIDKNIAIQRESITPKPTKLTEKFSRFELTSMIESIGIRYRAFLAPLSSQIADLEHEIKRLQKRKTDNAKLQVYIEYAQKHGLVCTDEKEINRYHNEMLCKQHHLVVEARVVFEVDRDHPDYCDCGKSSHNTKDVMYRFELDLNDLNSFGIESVRVHLRDAYLHEREFDDLRYDDDLSCGLSYMQVTVDKNYPENFLQSNTPNIKIEWCSSFGRSIEPYVNPEIKFVFKDE
jgi:hypothetical protein